MTVYSFSKPLPLDPDIPHDALDRFDCDVPVLNQWLRTRSVHNEKYGSSRTYVAFDEGGSIAGYFCISNAVLDHDRLSAGFRRNNPNPLPCCLLGRLAVDKRYQGQGLGGALLVEALKITQGVSRMSGCWALVVQPKGEKEIGFYEHLGFRRCKVGDPPMLFFEIEHFTNKRSPLQTEGRRDCSPSDLNPNRTRLPASSTLPQP